MGQPGEIASVIARTAVAEAVVPIHHALRELLRRIEALEKRTTPTAGAAPAIVGSAPIEREPRHRTAPSYTAALLPSPGAPALDAHGANLHVSAVESIHIDMEGSFDGARRRRRLALTFVVLLLVVFGGLFGALARSYTPHTSSRDTSHPDEARDPTRAREPSPWVHS